MTEVCKLPALLHVHLYKVVKFQEAKLPFEYRKISRSSQCLSSYWHPASVANVNRLPCELEEMLYLLVPVSTMFA